jgi:A/G-specific adenine glycosylase
MSVKHAYTHFRITLHAFHCHYVSGQPRSLGCADWRWVTLGRMSQYPFPKADKQLLEALLDGG